MINEQQIYAKFLLLKVENHPLFGINKQFHWPYRGNFGNNRLEDRLLQNYSVPEGGHDLEFLTEFIDDDLISSECTVCSDTLDPHGPGLADALFFKLKLKVADWPYDLLICSVFFSQLEYYLKYYIEAERYDSVRSICMPLTSIQLIYFFADPDLGPRFGLEMKKLNLLNRLEDLIFTLKFSGRDCTQFLSHIRRFNSPEDLNIAQECLFTYLTCLDINVLDAKKLAKQTIETRDITELDLFFANYLLEKESQLAIKKKRQKEVGEFKEFLESWIISTEESNLIIDAAKKKLETFQPVDICASFDDFPAASIINYDLVFQDFINTKKVEYLADFLKQVPTIATPLNGNENNSSKKLLIQKIVQENIVSYTNYLSEEKLRGLEGNYLSQFSHHSRTILALLLQTFYLGLALSSAIFFPLPLNTFKKDLSYFQTPTAFVRKSNQNKAVRAQQKLEVAFQSASLRSASNQDYTSVFFDKDKFGKPTQVQFKVTDGVVLYDIYGNSGSRDYLKHLETKALAYLSEQYPAEKFKLQRTTNQEFDHALNKNLGRANNSRSSRSYKKNLDPCHGTRLLKQVNTAKSNPTCLVRDPYFNYSNGSLFELLENYGKRGITSAITQFNSNPSLAPYGQQKVYQVRGMQNALKSQLEYIDEKFQKRYAIAETDGVLGLDLALVAHTFICDTETTAEFPLIHPSQAEAHLERCVISANKRSEFLRDGLSLISEKSPRYGQVLQPQIYYNLSLLLLKIEDRIDEATNKFSDFNDNDIQAKLFLLKKEVRSFPGNFSSMSKKKVIRTREELFIFGEEQLSVHNVNKTSSYWQNEPVETKTKTKKSKGSLIKLKTELVKKTSAASAIFLD